MTALRASAYTSLATFVLTLSFIMWGRHADLLNHSGTNRHIVELWKNAVMPGLAINQIVSVFGGQRENSVASVNINSALVWAFIAFMISIVLLETLSALLKWNRRISIT